MDPDHLFEIVSTRPLANPMDEAIALSRLRDIASNFREYNLEHQKWGLGAISADSAFEIDFAQLRSHAVFDVAVHSLQSGIRESVVWADKTANRRLDGYPSYSSIRTMIERFCSVIWVLGPEFSLERIRRTLRLQATELSELRRYSRTLERLDPGGDRTRRAKILELEATYLDGFRDLAKTAGLEDEFKTLSGARVGHGHVVEGAAAFLPKSRPVEIYALWAVASGVLHGQPLYSSSLSDTELIVFNDGITVQNQQQNASTHLQFAEASWLLFERAVELVNTRASSASSRI